jgi:hypothetical protein
MRLEKPATNPTRALRFDWRPLVLLAVVLAAIGLFRDERPLIWAAMAPFVAPLTLLAVPAMFLLPGLALLRLLWPSDLAPAERWPLALGVSSALPPLLLLLSEPLGLRWNTWLCWGILVLSTAVLLWPRGGESLHAAWLRRAAWRPDRPHLLLLAMTLAALVARLYPARDLLVGMWGDSYQHTIMAQLLVDHGGLFSSWEPYAPLKTFTYHFGFHSTVAWLHWLSHEPVTRGLLIVGQVQSALAVPLVYLLTRRTLGSERAGLWAALITGFVSAMPAYYLNWGRYTQLAGQTILPAVCVAWLALLEAAPSRSTARRSIARLILLAALTTAGLVLTHYRVAIFAACFVVSCGLYLILTLWRAPGALARLLGIGMIAGVLAVLIVAPWLLRLREGALLRVGSALLSTNIGTDQTNALPPATVLFSLYAKHYLVVLALLGVALVIRRRQWRGLILPLWAALVWLAANPYLIGLNGAGIITSFAVVIASYLLLAPLAGLAIAGVCDWLAQWLPHARPIGWVQILIGALVLCWGMGWQQSIVGPGFQLFTPADERAMGWIRRETPTEAAFFVNSFTAYSGSLYVGSDGGWWLPFMSGRRSSLPPLTYGSEAGEELDYAQSVNTTNATIERYPIDTPDAAVALRAAGYGYLYDGPTASGLAPGATEYIDPAVLARSPLYELVYQQDGVTIWRLR